MIQNMSLHQYLENLASASATPGGGAVAALTLAQAAALVSMVCAYTLGREKYKTVEDRVQKIMNQAQDIQRQALQATDEDSQAYEAVLKAYKLPSSSPTETATKTTEIQRSLKEAAAVPWRLFELCEDFFEKTINLRTLCNPNLISDVDVSLSLLQAATRSLWINVEVNLKLIQDFPHSEGWHSKAQKVILKIRSLNP